MDPKGDRFRESAEAQLVIEEEPLDEQAVGDDDDEEGS